MIRIVLLGRTGNNLFQYALGRVLAKKHGVPLVLDGSWFNAEGWKEVSHFLRLPIDATVVRRCSLATRALRKLTERHYWEFTQLPVIREARNSQTFDASHLDAPADCVIFGYFQSPLYFETIAEDLRSDINGLLRNSLPIDSPHHACLSRSNSVAVHVRRGDYLTQPVFQVCDLAYYHKAMNQMRDRVPGARFFVFSDDPRWCRLHLTAPDTEIMDSGTASANPLHDLHLMSLASHHVIANSSYSWWAAWLGTKDCQHVLLPDRWFTKDIAAPISEKLCPGWAVVGRVEDQKESF